MLLRALFVSLLVSAPVSAQCPSTDDPFHRLSASMCPHLNGTNRASWNASTTVANPVYEVHLFTASGYCQQESLYWKGETTGTSIELPIPPNVVYAAEVRIKGCNTFRQQTCGASDTFTKPPAAASIRTLTRTSDGAVELRARRSDFSSFGPFGVVQRPNGTIVHLGNPATTAGWCGNDTQFVWKDYGGEVTREVQSPPLRLEPGVHRYWLTSINGSTGFTILRGTSSPFRELVVAPAIELRPAIKVEPATGFTAGRAIVFNDASLGAVQWRRWDFDGDGVTDDTGATARYAFRNPGTYRPALTVSDGRSVRKTTIEIAVSDPLPELRLAAFDTNPVWGAGHVDRRGDLVSDARILATGGREISGVAADGVTRILLRATSPNPTTVRFRFVANQSASGELHPPGGAANDEAIDVATIEVSSGVHVATAVWTPPDDIGAGVATATRTIEIEAVVSNSAGTRVRSLALQLARVPVVFVHGLWSNAATWRAFPLYSDPRFRVHAIDYEDTNASAFAVNVPKLDAITTAIRAMRGQGFAVARADVVAHSMGGILARLWSGQTHTTNDENYHRGSIRKLVTLDTPHLGSPLAPFLLSIRHVPVAVTPADVVTTGELLARLGYPIGDAIEDLVPGSAALQQLTSSPPTHAIVGTGARTPCSAASSTLAKIAPPEVAFADEPNDLIVSAASQRGGFPAEATSEIGGRDGVHLCNTSSSWYSDRVAELLDSGDDFSDDAGASAPERSAAAVRAHETPPRVTLSLSSSAITPGEIVRATVSLDGAAAVKRIAVAGPHVYAEISAAPYEIDLEIPADAPPGPMALTALAIGDEFLGASSPVELLVNGPAPVALEVIPKELLIDRTRGEGAEISVIAIYENGATRKLGAADGVQMSVVDERIARITSPATITGVAAGETEVLVTSGELTTHVPVTVLSSPSRRRRSVRF